jgi:ribosomal protein L40E
MFWAFAKFLRIGAVVEGSTRYGAVAGCVSAPYDQQTRTLICHRSCSARRKEAASVSRYICEAEHLRRKRKLVDVRPGPPEQRGCHEVPSDDHRIARAASSSLTASDRTGQFKFVRRSLQWRGLAAEPPCAPLPGGHGTPPVTTVEH